MYTFWFILGGLAVLAYLGLELKVSYYVIKQLKVESMKMPGEKWHYIAASSILTFIIISAVSIGAINYVNAPNGITCWIIPSVIISLTMGWTMSQRLNKASFK